MDEKLAKRDYQAQRYNARARGIKWQFDYETWINQWEDWLGYKWQELRGRKRGQHVMARDEDKGPYAPWNVHLATADSNQEERVVNGTSLKGVDHAMAKLTEEQVKVI